MRDQNWQEPAEKGCFRLMAISVIAFIAIVVTMCATSCGKFMTEPEWNDLITNHNNNPNDTIVTQPIVIPPDTCHQLIHLTDTAFVCLSVPFDVTPVIVGFHWYGSNNTITYLTLQGLIDTYYPQLNGHYTYYQNSKGIAMFIEGTDNTIQFNGKIGVWCTNQSNRLLTANKYAISDYGSLTFEQEMYEANHRLNIHFYTLSGTNFTQSEYDQIIRARNHFDECKAGEIFADFSFKNVSQSVRDSTTLYQWIVKH